MDGSIFSTYSGGENRVTASILAVMRSLSIQRIERLLGALTEDASFGLVSFKNQVAAGGTGVPDAVIESSCRLLIETKIKPNTVDLVQLQGHLGRLDGRRETECLLVLTPDETCPSEIGKLADARVSWSSFSALDQAIDELLADKTDVISEREAFLLRELQLMLAEEGLFGFDKDTVVIAARHAWPEYQQVHAYICQPERSFQSVDYLGFYSEGKIHPLVARVLDVHERIVLESGRNEGALAELVNKILTLKLREPLTEAKLLLLSPPDAPETIRLGEPVENDLRSSSGRKIAFTQGQRYVSLANLKMATTTTELVASESSATGK